MQMTSGALDLRQRIPLRRRWGLTKAKFVRLRSGIFYTLNKLAEAGHCYTTREQLTGRAKELLEVEEPELEITLDEMLRTNDVIRDEGRSNLSAPILFFRKWLCKAAASVDVLWKEEI